MAITWYKGLYTGSMIRRRADEVREKISEGTYPPGVFLVTLPAAGHGLLEIFAAGELKNSYVRRNVAMVVGIAFSRSEAEYLIQKIVQDTWKAQKNADVGHFLKEKDRG